MERNVARPRRARPDAFACVSLGLASWGAVLALNPRRSGDLRIFRIAAQRLLAGAPLYPASDGSMPFKYAPAAAQLFLPLAFLPATAAAVGWNLASVLLAWLAGRALSSWARREGAPLPAAALAVAVLALWQSFFLELFYGQADLVMLALLLLAALWSAARPAVAGSALAAAVLLKPTAALVLPWLLVERRWRALGWTAVLGLALFVPVGLRYGLAGLAAQLSSWGETLSRTTPPWVLGHNPQGLPTLLLAPFWPLDARPGPRALAVAQLVAAGLLVAAPLALRLRGTALWACLCFATAAASPLAWRANFVLASPMLALLLARGGRVGAGAVALVGIFETLACEAVLGPEWARALLAARVFGAALLAAWVVSLVVFRGGNDVSCRRPAPR